VKQNLFYTFVIPAFKIIKFNLKNYNIFMIFLQNVSRKESAAALTGEHGLLLLLKPSKSWRHQEEDVLAVIER
jgi:hypothetical protein